MQLRRGNKLLDAFNASAAGVHALIGAHEGSSPNPPINGLRVQLVDLWRNLVWLNELPTSALLPDRSAHNRALRLKYPDYYYDLSRKHTAHLETVHWLLPDFNGETVGQARERMIASSLGLLSGAALTRPVLVEMPSDPITAAHDSVNRGGCTFILDPRTLTETPNTAVLVAGREARRSDMVWAIINRYYRRKVIKRITFPVLHLGRVTNKPDLNLEKVTGEIVGSAFYGAFTEYLAKHRHHDLHFTTTEKDAVCDLIAGHVDRRIRALALSFYRIRGLTVALDGLSPGGELDTLIGYLRRWFSPTSFSAIEKRVRTVRHDDFQAFLTSLQPTADQYAAATVQVGFLHRQLHMTSG